MEIATVEKLNSIEKKLLNLPQVDCPVRHHFGPGLYIREVTLPTGAIVMGHAHKSDNMNIMLKGKMLLLGIDGSVKELVAPQTFVNPPGRKVAYILEEVIWQNVHATEETNLEILEDMFVEKSQVWLEHQELSAILEKHNIQQIPEEV